jgi:hypothetical protein
MTDDHGAAPDMGVTEVAPVEPDESPRRSSGVVGGVLAGLAQAQPAIFEVTRAGARTQAQASLALGLVGLIVAALRKRKR